MQLVEPLLCLLVTRRRLEVKFRELSSRAPGEKAQASEGHAAAELIIVLRLITLRNSSPIFFLFLLALSVFPEINFFW